MNKWICSRNLKFIKKTEYCFIAGRSYDESVEDRTTENNKFLVNELSEIHSVTSVGWLKYFTKL